jgi:hypothetical protein
MRYSVRWKADSFGAGIFGAKFIEVLPVDGSLSLRADRFLSRVPCSFLFVGTHALLV